MVTPRRRLELRDVVVDRGAARILDRVSLSVGSGEIVAVIGPNGAGKSTLLEAIVGSVPMASGSVTLDGRRLVSLTDRARALVFLAGEGEPTAELRVGAVLDHVAAQGENGAMVRELAARLGLDGLRGARAGSLSRGERRRLLLFEALASDRPFLLLDEPTGVFDPLQLMDVVELLRAATNRGAGLLVTVHQMSDAEALGARLVLLNRGRVVAAGSLAELRARASLGDEASLHDVFVALLREEVARVAP